MGYTIVYDRMFLKTTRGIIPMLLAGSSNCTMFSGGKEILERSWFVPRREFIEQSGEAIMARVNDLIPDDETDQVWKANGKWQSSHQVRQWYANGIKHAATLEELRSVNPTASVRCFLYRYDAESSCTNECLHSFCSNTAQLEKWIDDATEEINTKGAKWEIHMGFSTIKPLRKPQSAKGNDGPVVLRKNGTRGHYATDVKIVPGSWKSVTWTTDIDAATQFANVDEAMSKAGGIIREFGLRIVKYAPKASKTFVITKETMKGSIAFVEQSTRNRIYYTYDCERAKRFKSESEARRWIDAKRGRYSPDALNALSVHRLPQ